MRVVFVLGVVTGFSRPSVPTTDLVMSFRLKNMGKRDTDDCNSSFLDAINKVIEYDS